MQSNGIPVVIVERDTKAVPNGEGKNRHNRFIASV
jgi:hypothetical protein